MWHETLLAALVLARQLGGPEELLMVRVVCAVGCLSMCLLSTCCIALARVNTCFDSFSPCIPLFNPGVRFGHSFHPYVSFFLSSLAFARCIFS